MTVSYGNGGLCLETVTPEPCICICVGFVSALGCVMLINHCVLLLLPSQASHAFSVAAMGELSAIYAARGNAALAANLSRHLSNMEAMQSMKQAGKLHGNQAWISYYKHSSQPEQRQVIDEAWQQKRDLGLIRERRGRGSRSGRHTWQQQQQQAGRQQQQQQQHEQAEGEQLALGLDLDSVVEAFDFAGAAAAAADQHRLQQRDG